MIINDVERCKWIFLTKTLKNFEQFHTILFAIRNIFASQRLRLEWSTSVDFFKWQVFFPSSNMHASAITIKMLQKSSNCTSSKSNIHGIFTILLIKILWAVYVQFQWYCNIYILIAEHYAEILNLLQLYLEKNDVFWRTVSRTQIQPNTIEISV